MQIGPDTKRRSTPALAIVTVATLVVGLILPSSAAAQPDPRLTVNEFFFRGEDSDLEFVEIYNGSADPVDLTTVQLSDSRRRPVDFSNSIRILETGGYAVAVRDGATFDLRFDYAARLEPTSWPTLNNGGDTVILWRDGVVVDSVRFNSSWGGDDVSLERIDPDGPSNHPSNWAESVNRDGGTPGRLNSVFAPDTRPPRVVFCEEARLGTLAIYFSEPLEPGSVITSAFRFDTGASPRQVTVDPSREIVYLPAEDAGQASGITIDGVRDGSGNVLRRGAIPIAWLPAPGDLRINEVMYEPLADDFDGLPDQPEYLEIVSTADRLISIGSLVLTDRLREDGTRDTIGVDARRIAVGPKEMLLIHARPDPDQEALGAFPRLDQTRPGLVILPIDQSSLAFGNSGDLIRVEGGGGLVDQVDYRPSWHLAERVTTRGFSLERISLSVGSDDPANWSSSVDPSGGTPGRRNSITLDPVSGPDIVQLSVSPSPFSPDGDGFEDFATISIRIDKPTAVVRVWVYDLDGVHVRDLERGRPVSFSSSIIWDGRDAAGRLLQPGVYVILAEAVDIGSGYLEQFKGVVALVR